MFKAIFAFGKLIVSLIGFVFFTIITLYKICASLCRANEINKDTDQEIERLTREIDLAERKRCLENKLNAGK